MPQAPHAGPRSAVSRAAAAWALVAGACFFLFSDPFLSPPDCALYWSWAQSLFHDLDFAFWNDYAGFEVPVRYVYLTGASRISNDWPIGAGLALGPVVLLGKSIAHAWTILFCVGAMALWTRAARDQSRQSGLSREWGLGAMIAGTPVLFYLSFGPFFSHAASFAATTAFLAVWSTTRGNRTMLEWILLGFLLGLATVVRPQNALLAIAFLAELPARFTPRFLPFAAGAALLAFAPQLIAWQFLYGSPLALPKVDEMRWLSPAIGETVLSDYHGVLPWTPIYIPALAGLFLLYRMDARLATGLLLMLAVQLHVNAANEVWWAGGSFGNRRLMDGAIVVAWGIAALAGIESKPARWTARAAIVACCAWTTWLLLAERAGALPLSRHVPFASAATRFLVLARTGPADEAVDLFLVDPQAPGVALRQQKSLASDTQYEVTFVGVRVPATARIGAAGSGWGTWDRALLDGVVLLAAYAMGGAERALEITVQYAKDRKQFDKPLGAFQAISHYLADAATAVDGGKTLVYEAAWARDRGRPTARLAPMAKLFACRTWRDVTAMCQQVWGGVGFTIEYDIQLYFRRAKQLQITWWDERTLEERVAADVLDGDAPFRSGP